MNKILSITLILFSLLSCQEDPNNREIEQEIISVSPEMEQDYPWEKRITEKAIIAIELSINNLTLPPDKRDSNFPDTPGPSNVPFTHNEIVEFHIIGYSHSESTPEIYDIEFQENKGFSGPRITVKMNIESGEALKVYMKADS